MMTLIRFTPRASRLSWFVLRHVRVLAVVALVVGAPLAAEPASGVDDPAPVMPSASPAAVPSTLPSRSSPPALPTRPLLERLNRETQELYRSLEGGVLRVQMPSPRWASDLVSRDNRWDKYPQLDPAVRQQLTGQPTRPQRRAFPSTQPLTISTGPAPVRRTGSDVQSAPQQGVVIVVPTNTVNPDGANAAEQRLEPAVEGGTGRHTGNAGNTSEKVADVATVRPQTPTAATSVVPNVVPNNIGLVLDEQGHVLVPLYVERDSVGGRPIRLVAADGGTVQAHYIGSDQPTNLTVLQLSDLSAKPKIDTANERQPQKDADDAQDVKIAKAKPAVSFKPVSLSGAKPAEGSLVLYLSPADGSGRLGIWNNNSRDYGVVVGVDGQVLGIARYGQFLSGSACRLIAEQIIRQGAVRRATLGVFITQIDRDDPLRQRQPLLGERPAVRVDQVVKGSAADRGGLRQGDVILALDDEAVNDIPSLAAAIAARSGKTAIQVLRGGEVIEVTVDLQPK